MAAPRVFISSTWYDLRYIRENLKFFVRRLGYEPVLSEEGAVLFDPKMDVQDACLAEVPSCQMFVLIIGGRRGSGYHDTEKSVTNAEYDEAVKAKVRIFVLVERPVLDEHAVYMANKKNAHIEASAITYPSVDSTQVFDFIERVRGEIVNNAIVPFSDFEDIESYLRQQWASMMNRFLTTETEAVRVGSMLTALSTATDRIEFLTRTVVDSVGDKYSRLSVELYDEMLKHTVVHDLSFWGIHPTPQMILGSQTLDALCNQALEADKEADAEDSYSISGGGPPYRACTARLDTMRTDYLQLRDLFLSRLKESGISAEEFAASTSASTPPSARPQSKRPTPRW